MILSSVEDVMYSAKGGKEHISLVHSPVRSRSPREPRNQRCRCGAVAVGLLIQPCEGILISVSMAELSLRVLNHSGATTSPTVQAEIEECFHCSASGTGESSHLMWLCPCTPTFTLIVRVVAESFDVSPPAPPLPYSSEPCRPQPPLPASLLPALSCSPKLVYLGPVRQE